MESRFDTRANTGQTPSPHPFRDRADAQEFVRLCIATLAPQGEHVDLRDGSVYVAGSRAGHGLTNLAQHCSQLPKTAWRRAIAEHFAKSTPDAARRTSDVFTRDYADIAHLLAVRLQPSDFLAGPLGKHLVHRVDVPETHSVLCVDLGPSIAYVPAPLAKTWPASSDELFARALDNLAQGSSSRWEDVDIPAPGAFPLQVLYGDCYATSHLLRLTARPPRLGAHGNLIGLPTRDMLFSWPIDSLPRPAILEALVAIAHGKFGDGPNSITSNLYWRRPDGLLEAQHGSIREHRARLAPSAGLADLLRRLQRPPT